jgi:hypothetical protein
MGTRVRTTRLATILLSACAAIFPLIPKVIAQTPNADCTTESTSSTKACEAGTTSSVLMSSERESATTSSAGLDQKDWVHRWMRTVDQARASQPHYVAPLITTHVVLVEQYRFDSSWQTNSNGAGTANYGNSRGLEIIPNSRMEVQIAPPPYIVHSDNTADGFGDVSMFAKFRAFSAPEGKGDYFVGLFFGALFPTGNRPNGTGHTVLSPMLAMAKGWGTFSIQNTLSGNLPTSGTNQLGRAFLWNTAFQYGIKGKAWPMIEQNSTFYFDGPLSGKKQTFLTPGVVFGPFQIAERLHFAVGAGVQIAVTQFHTYDHHWVWTMRFPF